VVQGQFSTPPCIVHSPRGPIRSGPILFSRRPSLSQQPAGSHTVMAPALGMASGGCGAATAGGEGGADRCPITGGGTVCGGLGAPERSRLPLLGPRQARAACRRARLSRCERACPSGKGSLIACSSCSRAAAHSLELSGSVSGTCARKAVVAAAVSNRVATNGAMTGLEPCPEIRFSFTALSDTAAAKGCLTWGDPRSRRAT
jgi:hypothetical protein